MFIVKHITTGDIIGKSNNLMQAITLLREFLSKYTKVNDYEVDIIQLY
jgi:hypothetical protein